ncbi:MAG: GNAT family N-acetyltransferase, partial [Bacteroidales bacterium]|nr:GNAT family N-acetyltransferase [Bacteroidales bacterium]
YVLPDFRQQGVFKAMFRFVKDEALKNGAAGLRLYVEKNNITAQKTYERLGMNDKHYSMFEWLKE